MAWFDTRNKSSIYVRATSDFGQTWQEEVRIKNDAPGDILPTLQLAGDAQGHLYVAWADNREGAHHIYLVVSADFGRTWSTETCLDVTPARDKAAGVPALAADAAGHVYVVWQDARHGGWDIYGNVSRDYGQTWRPEDMRLNTGPAGEALAQFPQIALDTQGHVVVAWQEDRGAEQEEGVYLTWSEDFGTSWHTPDIRVDAPKPREAAFRPQIAALREKTFLLAWEVRRQDQKDIALKVVDLSAHQAAQLQPRAAEEAAQPAPVEALRLKERAEAFWDAKVKQDYAAQHSFFEPKLRRECDLACYTKRQGPVKYLEAHIEGVKVDEARGTVMVRLLVQVKVLPQAAPNRSEADISEEWVHREGEWYRLYPQG